MKDVSQKWAACVSIKEEERYQNSETYTGKKILHNKILCHAKHPTNNKIFVSHFSGLAKAAAAQK